MADLTLSVNPTVSQRARLGPEGCADAFGRLCQQAELHAAAPHARLRLLQDGLVEVVIK